MEKMKYGICQWCLPVEGTNAIKVAAELGLEGIELNFGKDAQSQSLLQKDVQQAYLEAGKEWGITFPAIGVNILCQFGMSKVQHQDIVMDILNQVVDIASEMGIPLVQLPSFVDGAIETEEEFIQTLEMLKYACRIADMKGIIIGTENALSWEDNLRLIQDCEYKNLRVYFDTQNPYLLKGYKVAEMVDKLGAVIGEVHAKDGIQKMGSTLLGEGESGFFETVERLKHIEYVGWVHLENNYVAISAEAKDEDPLPWIRKDVDTLKRVFT